MIGFTQEFEENRVIINLDCLLKIQTTLVGQTRRLADAIQTLEVLSGFRE